MFVTREWLRCDVFAWSLNGAVKCAIWAVDAVLKCVVKLLLYALRECNMVLVESG